MVIFEPARRTEKTKTVTAATLSNRYDANETTDETVNHVAFAKHCQAEAATDEPSSYLLVSVLRLM